MYRYECMFNTVGRSTRIDLADEKIVTFIYTSRDITATILFHRDLLLVQIVR